jgi:hypothetical protein
MPHLLSSVQLVLPRRAHLLQQLGREFEKQFQRLLSRVRFRAFESQDPLSNDDGLVAFVAPSHNKSMVLSASKIIGILVQHELFSVRFMRALASIGRLG